MNPLVKNILAVIVGWIVGSILNMLLVQAGHAMFPIPDVNPENLIELAIAMPTLAPKYFVFPFLSHALGTLLGAIVTSLMAAKHHMKLSITIGILFLIGGILINYILTGPIWFVALDLIVAYIPMAWLGGILAKKLKKQP